jgi:hypothetical protein
MSWAKARSHWLAIHGLTKYAALKPLLVSFSPLEEMTLNANKISVNLLIMHPYFHTW